MGLVLPPGDPLGSLRIDPIRIPAADCLHLFKPLAPRPAARDHLARACASAPARTRPFKDAALVKAKVAALFIGFITDPGTAGGRSGATA